MARGFDSKAVEAQQEAAQNRTPLGPPVSRDEAARRGELATLTLARARADADLQRATVEAHRTMLERAIADLDARIAALNG